MYRGGTWQLQRRFQGPHRPGPRNFSDRQASPLHWLPGTCQSRDKDRLPSWPHGIELARSWEPCQGQILSHSSTSLPMEQFQPLRDWATLVTWPRAAQRLPGSESSEPGSVFTMIISYFAITGSDSRSPELGACCCSLQLKKWCKICTCTTLNPASLFGIILQNFSVPTVHTVIFEGVWGHDWKVSLAQNCTRWVGFRPDQKRVYPVVQVVPSIFTCICRTCWESALVCAKPFILSRTAFLLTIVFSTWISTFDFYDALRKYVGGSG